MRRSLDEAVERAGRPGSPRAIPERLRGERSVAIYLRLLQVQILEEKLAEFRQFYDERVFPALAEMEGCLFATLLQKSFAPDDCVSLTVWRDRESWLEYERAKLFRDLIREAEPFIASRAQWRVRPEIAGEEDTADLLPGPPVATYSAAEGDQLAIFAAEVEGPRHPYLRIVAAEIKPGRMDEFRHLYHEQIVPVLTEEVPGCRGIFLAENTEDPNSALSITIWDREDDALRYEMSGTFDELAAPLSDLFAGVYQWSVSLESELGLGPAREQLEVRGYEVVAGGRL